MQYKNNGSFTILSTVRNSTILKTNAYSSLGWYGLFLTCGKNKKNVRHIHIILQACDYSLLFTLPNMDIFELLACCWYWCELVPFISMFSVDCSTLLCSEMGLFIDALHSSQGPVWFGCPIFGCLAWNPSPHTQTLLQVIKAWWNSKTSTYPFNHINSIYSWESDGLTDPELLCLEQVRPTM